MVVLVCREETLKVTGEKIGLMIIMIFVYYFVCLYRNMKSNRVISGLTTKF